MTDQHRRRLHDQEHLPETVTMEQLGKLAENRAVSVIEGRAGHLPLQSQQLHFGRAKPSGGTFHQSDSGLSAPGAAFR